MRCTRSGRRLDALAPGSSRATFARFYADISAPPHVRPGATPPLSRMCPIVHSHEGRARCAGRSREGVRRRARCFIPAPSALPRRVQARPSGCRSYGGTPSFAAGCAGSRTRRSTTSVRPGGRARARACEPALPRVSRPLQRRPLFSTNRTLPSRRDFLLGRCGSTHASPMGSAFEVLPRLGRVAAQTCWITGPNSGAGVNGPRWLR